MLPFLEIPLLVPGNENAIGRLQPNEFACYYPDANRGTVIVTKGGSVFITSLTAEQLDGALLAYHNSLKANTGKFGNLQISSPKSKLHTIN